MPRPAIFNGQQSAQEAYERMTAHLRTNSVNMDREQLRVGPMLEIDPRSETFKNNAAATAMLTREYRRGFEVPARF